MWLNDFLRGGIKIFRDRTVIKPEYKANQGVSTVQDANTGEYTMTKQGEEEGWLYTANKSGSTRTMGSWSMATPAILQDNVVRPMLNKAMDADMNYEEKTLSTTSGDSSSTVRVAESTDDKVTGILVSCLNHESEEQIFFPISRNTPSVYGKVQWDITSLLGDFSLAELCSVSPEGVPTPLGELVWIDALQSTTKMTHIGNHTIYELSFLKEEHTRDGVTRPLYYVKGIRITTVEDELNILHKVSLSEDGTYDCEVMDGETPFYTVEASIRKTTINGDDLPNRISGKLSNGWSAVVESFTWAKVSSIQPLLVTAVAPIAKNTRTYIDEHLLDGSTYNGQTEPPENSISTYVRNAI